MRRNRLMTLLWRVCPLSDFEDESGQTLAEYALILTLVVIAAIVAVTLFGGKLGDMFSGIDSHLKDVLP